jgi:UDP-2-acetamido-3-amino-2,3-dideoxy-glucuronate N-acetyltransferase
LSEAWVHPTAVVDAGARLGEGTRIWHFCHVMDGAVIGQRCMLGQNCFVSAGVHIGDGVRVQNNVSLYDGVVLEDDVFCGPSAVFTNVRHPRAFVSRRGEFESIRIRRGATLGANCTVLSGVTVGEYAFVGAGAVVTRDVASFSLVMGVPAEPMGWVSRAGERLDFGAGALAACPRTGMRYRLDPAGLVELGQDERR